MQKERRKFEVGQKLWLEYYHSKSGVEVVVESVGRKWVHLNNKTRFDPATMQLDTGGYSVLGRAHLSREEWEAEMALKKAWGCFRNVFGYIPRAGVTLEDITEAARLLKLDITG